MALTREDVAHLEPGMEVTARFARGDHPFEPLTGRLEDLDGYLYLGGVVVRYEDGSPSRALAEVVAPKPPPAWYALLDDLKVGDKVEALIQGEWTKSPVINIKGQEVEADSCWLRYDDGTPGHYVDDVRRAPEPAWVDLVKGLHVGDVIEYQWTEHAITGWVRDVITYTEDTPEGRSVATETVELLTPDGHEERIAAVRRAAPKPVEDTGRTPLTTEQTPRDLTPAEVADLPEGHVVIRVDDLDLNVLWDVVVKLRTRVKAALRDAARSE